MATHDILAWTYTNGYPKTLKKSIIKVPRASEVKSIGTTPHMLVKIAACALNPVDIQLMNQPKWNLPFSSFKAEKGCVCDFSGTVISGGRTGFQRGDEVFGMQFAPFEYSYSGALGQQAEFNMEHCVAMQKPAHWSHEQAAAISLVWLTAKAQIEAVTPWVEKSASKRVAVLGGSSATGIYTIMLAKRRGWKVVATSSARNRDFVISTLKADEHVDYTKEDVRAGVAAFRPEAVIDCVGGTECIGLPGCKRYITIVGDKTGRAAMGGPYTYIDILHPWNAAAQWIRWARGQAGLGEIYDVIILQPKRKWLEEARDTLRPEDIFIDSVFSFDDAKKAFERLATGRVKGKVVVKVS